MVFQENREGEGDDGGGEGITGLVTGGQDDKQEVGHITSLVAVPPEVELEDEAEEEAEEAEDDGGGDEEAGEVGCRCLGLHDCSRAQSRQRTAPQQPPNQSNFWTIDQNILKNTICTIVLSNFEDCKCDNVLLHNNLITRADGYINFYL